MEAIEQVFKEFLHGRKLKYTSERVAILRAAQSFGRPFEAEELLLTLRENGDRVSKATVYRTLKHLVEAQLVKQVFFGGSKQSHYDFIGGEMTSHDHLLELDTGRIIPFDNEEVVALRDKIAAKLGFEVIGHRFQIIGRKIEQ